MGSSFDLFFDAADRSSITHSRTTTIVSGATELLPEGSSFTVSGAPSIPFYLGQRVAVVDIVTSDVVNCVIAKITSTTQVTLRPLFSVLDTVSLPYTFPNSSLIIATDESAATCIVDLSEAPDDTYDLLVVGCGSLTTTGTPGDVFANLRINALQDDPYSGTGGHGDCRVTLGNASYVDRVNFVAATRATLVGGQRYEHALNFSSAINFTATLTNPRLLALRYTSGHFAGDGKTAQQNTTDAVNFSDHLDLGADLPAGQYLVACTWALGSASGVAAECRLEADGSTVLAHQISVPKGGSNFIPGGFFGLVTLGGTNRVRLRYRSVGGATCSIKNAFLAAIPVANIPAFAAVHVSQDLTTNFSQSVSNDNFVTAKTSDSVTLETGRHIEIIAASMGADAAFRSRGNFGAAGTSLAGHHIELGTGSDRYVPTFWFIRNQRQAGATTNAVEMRRNTSSTTTLRARDFTFSWLREQPDFVAQPDEPVAVVADVEMGGRVYKRWNSTTTTRRYSHRISDYDMMSRVRVSPPAGSPLLTEYVRVYSLGAMTDGTWFWDAFAHDLYIQLTTAHAAIGEPSSDALHVVVVPLLLVGRQKHDLIDAMGTPWPYRPLLDSVPTKTQTLRSANARFSTASSLGQLQVAMAHGEFDDKLFRSYFESYRAKVRRGYPRQSKRLADFEVVADSTIRRPTSDFKTLTLRLLDRRRLLQTPVANTRVTVREGYGSDARQRENQELPVVWGETLGLVAYRITANEGGTDWNEYQFCDHAVKSVTKVWIDGERRKAIAATNPPLDTSSPYIGAGKVRVRNDAFDEPTQPPDVVYVDLEAGRTSDGTVSGRALHTPGEIARDLVVTYGGTPATRLIEKTFRMIDRRYRWQQKAAGGRRPVAPRVALLVSGRTSVEQALTKLCGDVHGYWIVNHQDRVGLDVPDFDRGNMIRNMGFEDDSASPYPWSTLNSATLALTTARRYVGARSAEISNGSSPNAEACAVQTVYLAAGELHAVTLVASLLEGVPDSFRIGVVGPSGVETLSEPMTLGTGRWSRHTLVYESEPGDAGHTEVRIYPAYGSTTATRVAVDNVEMYRVACSTDRIRSEPIGLDWEDEHYYECAVPYAVNLANPGQVAKRNVGESEARGFSSAIEPEGKYAIQSATRAELNDTRAADGDSAGGIAAAVALQYSRERPVLTIEVHGLDRLPVVGDYVVHRDNPRIPESADEYPIWRVAEVSYGERGIRLKIRRQRDPVEDRVDIAPDNIPMGAGALTVSSGAITDYDEETDLRNQFLMAHTAPDLTTQRGDLFHKHSLSHVHPLPLHQHVATLISHGIDAAGAAGVTWPVKYDGKYAYPAPVGPQDVVRSSRGLTNGGHTHPVPGTPQNVAQASGTSSTPNATIETAPGPNEPSYRRVRVMRRVANTQDVIDANLIVGFRTASLPAGWLRCDGNGGRPNLDGIYLRGATPNGAVSTTVATATFTPNDAGSTLNVASGTGISVGKRLRVRRTDDGNKQVHVVVTAGSGTAWTVVPLHETTDEPNTYTFPAGASSTVVGDSEAVNTAYAAPTHKHGGTMPSHQHAAGGHVHAAGDAQFVLGFADQGIDAQKLLGGGLGVGEVAAGDEHVHEAAIVPPAANTNSGSAAGTLTGDVAPTPAFYEIVWAVSDGNQRTIPAGGILPWAQSDVAPGGWRKIGEAAGLLIKGAAAGQAPTSGTGGHAHTQSNAAHTMAHAHGGTVIVPSEAPSGTDDVVIGENAAADTISVAAGVGSATDLGHAHQVTASLSSVDPGLSANSHATGGALLGLPLHKRIVLIEKQ